MLSKLLRVAAIITMTVILFFTVSSVAAGDDGDRTFAPPAPYYLSLGDSIGFGLQLDRLFEMLDHGTYTPDAFQTGYTDVFAARMHGIRSDQQVVNMSCPAESTYTMINGGCFFSSPDGFGLMLHTNYAGPQLDAAVAFLRSHPGQVSPVTLSMGVNDVTGVISECHFDATCVEQSGIRNELNQALGRILAAIRAAAPHTEIIVVALYNPFSISNPGTDGLWRRAYTNVEKDAAGRYNARLADTSDVVHGTDQVCKLTFLCGSGDVHPTDAGYAAIADLIFRVSGYGRLERGS